MFGWCGNGNSKKKKKRKTSNHPKAHWGTQTFPFV